MTTTHAPTPTHTRRLRRRTWIGAAFGLALLGGAAVYTLSRVDATPTAGSGTSAPPPPTVTIAPVEERLVTEHEELLGRVEAMETVELRPRVSGHIQAVKFQAGQVVEKGDVLFVIDPRWHQAAHEMAKGRSAEAKAHAAVAEREAARAEELLRAQALSAEEAEARRARANEARAAALAADAALQAAQLDLEYTEVRAPISGRVSRALVTPGNLVSGAPGGATVLTTIVSVGKAYVYADVDEATVLKFNRLQREGRLALKNGRLPVHMQLSDESGYPREGYLESVDNRLDPSTGSLVLRMVFDDPDGSLVPGLYTRVRLPISAPQRALLISERAVGTDQSQKFVLTVTPERKVAYRTVKLGPAVQGKRVVRDGLQPGETVVVNGLQRVRPGMTVAPQVAANVNPSPSVETARLAAAP